jgi:hypothetical protein
MNDPARPSATDGLGSLAEALNTEPFFRAVSADGKRKGLRLERDYWSLLDMIAREENVSIGDIVSAIELRRPERQQPDIGGAGSSSRTGSTSG